MNSKIRHLSLSLLLLMLCLPNGFSQDVRPYGDNLVSTYSIVAIDTASGQMGVAVQSHWFSVGSIVSWAEAGVGVIATQSFVNVSYGPRGLDLLRRGLNSQDVVKDLIAKDSGEQYRQLAVLSAKGNIAAHTGSACIREAGHLVGPDFAVQANLMANDKVWTAMAEAFKTATGSLAERMLTSLEAAEAVGGDIRGKQSAAILVVRLKASGKVWEDRLVDLRIEDHAEPIAEMKRLLTVHQAYEFMNKGDLAMEHEDTKNALLYYGSAQKLQPQNMEMKYWHAVSLANIGRVDDALPIFEFVFESGANWRILTKRLAKTSLLKISKTDLNRILKE